MVSFASTIKGLECLVAYFLLQKKNKGDIMETAAKTTKAKTEIKKVSLPENLFIKILSAAYTPPERGEVVTTTTTSLKQKEHRQTVDEPFTLRLSLDTRNAIDLLEKLGFAERLQKETVDGFYVTLRGDAKKNFKVTVECRYNDIEMERREITRYTGTIEVGEEIAPYCYASADQAGPQYETTGYEDVPKQVVSEYKSTREVDQETFSILYSGMMNVDGKEISAAKEQIERDYPDMIRPAKAWIGKRLAKQREDLLSALKAATNAHDEFTAAAA